MATDLADVTPLKDICPTGADYGSLFPENETVEDGGAENLGLLNKTDKEDFSKWLRWCAGCVLAVVGSIAWTTGGGCAQALGGFVPIFELNLARYILQLACLSPVLIIRRYSVFDLDKKQAFVVCITSALGVAYNFAFYEASIYLPVSMLGGLESMLLMVYVAILSFLISKEWSKLTLVSAAICITGIILLTQPDFLFKEIMDNDSLVTYPVCVDEEVRNNNNAGLLKVGASVSTAAPTVVVLSTHDYNSTSTEATIIRSTTGIGNQVKGYTLVLASSALYAIDVVIHRLFFQTVKLGAITNFWMAMTGNVFCVVCMLAVETPMFPSSAPCIALLSGHAVFGGCASILSGISLALIPGNIFALLENLNLVFYLVAQYTVLRQVNPGHRNWLEIVGGIVVLIGSMVDPLYKTIEQRIKNEVPDT